MAKIPGLDRWTQVLRNAFRHRGPEEFLLEDRMSSVFDAGTDHPEFDDAIAYWYARNQNQNAVAAQFGIVSINCAVGRAVIDGISINEQAGLQAFNIGLSGGTALNALVALAANPFTSRVGATPPQGVGPITSNSTTAAASLLLGNAIAVSTPAGQGIVLGRLSGTLPQFIISPGFALTIETNAVNLNISVSVWGRWFPEIDPA